MQRAGWRAILVITAYTAGFIPGVPYPAQGAERTAVKGIDVSLTTDQGAYAPGERVTFTLRVVNVTAKPVTLTFRTGQRFELVIRNREGREVWRWAAGRMFTQVLGNETIQPSSELLYTATLDQRLAPGVYIATGVVTAREGDLTAGAMVHVAPR